MPIFRWSACRSASCIATGATEYGVGKSQEDFMREDLVLVVDYDDNVIGYDNKYNVHKMLNAQPKGIVHRAFSVMLFDGDGKMLLQQRATSKVTFPGVWTNACCSHPLKGQTPNEEDLPRTGTPRGRSCAHARCAPAAATVWSAKRRSVLEAAAPNAPRCHKLRRTATRLPVSRPIAHFFVLSPPPPTPPTPSCASDRGGGVRLIAVAAETSSEPLGVHRAALRKLKHELGIEPAEMRAARIKYMGARTRVQAPRTNTYTRACTHTHIHARTHPHIHARTDALTHFRTHFRTHARINARKHHGLLLLSKHARPSHARARAPPQGVPALSVRRLRGVVAGRVHYWAADTVRRACRACM
eukprot:6212541-Pleurochrysis_carterae.AAC.1